MVLDGPAVKTSWLTTTLSAAEAPKMNCRLEARVALNA